MVVYKTQLVLLVLMQLWPTMQTYTGRVLLVSMDGFRWDYLHKGYNLTNFQQMQREGASTKYMNTTFITVTFATHYSLATGLYQESHGIIANKMYDPVFKSSFRPGNVESRWWEGGEPIWTTATKNNVRVGTYYWPGSDVPIMGVLPKLYKYYDISVNFKTRIDTVLQWFARNQIDFGTLYFHEPDNTGHNYGPDSTNVKDKLKDMDELLGYLMQQMKVQKLDDVNVILVSDHGMTNVYNDKVLDLSKLLSPELVENIPYAKASCHIIPKEGKLEQVYAILAKQKHMKVYRKEQIPDHWHYKNNRRVTPLFALMDQGWRCSTVSWKISRHCATFTFKGAARFERGSHGYSNELMDMKPIFLAKGPDIQPNYTLPAGSFSSVDIYPLICELLGIKESPNNGSLWRVDNMLIKRDQTKTTTSRPSTSERPTTTQNFTLSNYSPSQHRGVVNCFVVVMVYFLVVHLL